MNSKELIENIILKNKNPNVGGFLRHYLENYPSFANQDIFMLIADIISIIESRCDSLEEENKELKELIRTANFMNGG